MSFSRPEKPDITPEIFDNLAESAESFAKNIRKHYDFLCFHGGYRPHFNDRRLEDAWVAFRRDKKHAPASLPDGGAPDHFKLGGILAYWLRRFAPVYDLHDLSMAYGGGGESLRELLRKYPSELPAFDMGLSVCDFFAGYKKTRPSPTPDVAADDFDYYKAVCYVMKFKNLSPHSMGMVYRALYVPVC